MSIDLFGYSIIALICTILLLGIVLVSIVLSYRKSLQKRQNLESEAESILNKAKEEALNIEKKEIYTQLQNLTSEEKEIYSKSLQGVSSDIKSYLLKEFKKDKDEMDQQMHSEIKNQYDLLMKQHQAELDAYKKQKMIQIDQSAESVLKDFIIFASAKSIPLEFQEELIINALEEAKKRNVF